MTRIDKTLPVPPPDGRVWLLKREQLKSRMTRLIDRPKR